MAGPASAIDHRRLTRHIIVFTLSVEAAGAVLLYVLWVPSFGATGAIWPAVFHSVSAFCNAGFSTFTDSLVGFDHQTALLTVVMALIVVGGIGFLLLEELLLWWRASRSGHRFRLSVHSRLVLATTAVLVIGGGLLFTFFEWDVTLAHLPIHDRFLNGLFLSVTARTAGFNTIDYADAASNTNFLTIILMSVGGSPGSTAGGLKTTTFALIGLLAWARLFGRDRINLWGRSIPEMTVQRSVGLFVMAFGIVTAAIFVLTSTELSPTQRAGLVGDETFLPLMFEAASAFNTVGVSMGITSGLSVAGRWTVIFLMFIGRVGVLTFAAALARRMRTVPFRYAYEDVGVG